MYNSYNERLRDETNALLADIQARMEDIEAFEAMIPAGFYQAKATCIQTLAILDQTSILEAK